MHRLLGFLLVVMVATTSHAQTSSVSISASYPVTIGTTFLSDYDGIVELQLAYAHPISQHIRVSPSVHYGLFEQELTGVNRGLVIDLSVIGAKLGALYTGLTLSHFPVLLGGAVGYNRFSFESTAGASQTQNGFGFSVTLRPLYPVTPSFDLGLNLEYEGTYLEKPEPPALDTAYNRWMQVLRFGLVAVLNL